MGSIIGGIFAFLTFLLTIFLEWPRFKERLGTNSSTLKNITWVLVSFWSVLGVGLFVSNLRPGGMTTSNYTWGRLGMGILFSYLGLLMFYLARGEQAENNKSIFFWVTFLNGLLCSGLAIRYVYLVF